MRTPGPASRARAAIVAMIACELGIACFGGRLPPLELYRLVPADTLAGIAEPDARRAPGTIAIAPYDAPGMYGRPGIVYRLSEAEYGTYRSREWAIPLEKMLGLLTQDLMRAHPVSAGRALFDPPGRRGTTYLWQGTVREFEEVDRAPHVFAAVKLDARLVRVADNAVVWRGSARAERRVSNQEAMTAIVATLSELAADVIVRLTDEARTALARTAESAPHSPPFSRDR
jgi:ABC-type uncharacterized transport system auxiliary subunit